MKREIIFVLGMHRSGTSYLTTALQALGFTLPGQLIGPNRANPRGYGEGLRIVRAHEKFMHALECKWWDIADFPSGWRESAQALELQGQIKDFLSGELDTLASDGTLVIKDPRICLTLPIWGQVLTELSCDARALFLLRSPGEVARSLDKRDNLNPLVSALLWWRYVANAYNALSLLQLRNATINYPGILHNPDRILGALARINERHATLNEGVSDHQLVKVGLDNLYRNRAGPPEAKANQIFSDCEKLMDRILREGSVQKDCERIEPHPSALQAGGWWPQWSRLYRKHESLLTTTRRVQKELENSLYGEAGQRLA